MSDKKGRSVDPLMNELSSKLGMNAGELKAAADSGALQGMLQNSQNPNAQKVSRILGDHEKTRELLQSPEAQKLMKLLNGD